MGPPAGGAADGPSDRERWIRAASTVAAYRDRYKVTGDLPLGGGAANDAQRADRRRAQHALLGAIRLASVSNSNRHEWLQRMRAVAAR